MRSLQYRPHMDHAKDILRAGGGPSAPPAFVVLCSWTSHRCRQPTSSSYYSSQAFGVAGRGSEKDYGRKKGRVSGKASGNQSFGCISAFSLEKHEKKNMDTFSGKFPNVSGKRSGNRCRKRATDKFCINRSLNFTRFLFSLLKYRCVGLPAPEGFPPPDTSPSQPAQAS